MKKIFSILALAGVFLLMSFGVNDSQIILLESPCQKYAVDQIIREINHFGPMSTLEIAESYDFYMGLCADGGMEDAVFISQN
jgi:hypothetical protein